MVGSQVSPGEHGGSEVFSLAPLCTHFINESHLVWNVQKRWGLKEGKRVSLTARLPPQSLCCEGPRGNSAKPRECAEGLGPSFEVEHSLICTGGHNIGDLLAFPRARRVWGWAEVALLLSILEWTFMPSGLGRGGACPCARAPAAAPLTVFPH